MARPVVSETETERALNEIEIAALRRLAEGCFLIKVVPNIFSVAQTYLSVKSDLNAQQTWQAVEMSAAKVLFERGYLVEHSQGGRGWTIVYRISGKGRLGLTEALAATSNSKQSTATAIATMPEC